MNEEKEYVFISYARKDLTFAAAIRQGFRSEGVNVWWDEDIQCGSDWKDKLDQALVDASAIIVVWSQNSVESSWVAHEAAVGKGKGILVNILIDNTDIPVFFSARQAANLNYWRFREDEPEFLGLIREAKRILDQHRTARTNSRRAQIGTGLLFLLTIASLALSMRSLFIPLNLSRISQDLRSFDPLVFSHSQDDIYDFSRLIVNEHDLYNETNLNEMLSQVRQSWDLLTFSGSIVDQHREELSKALQRGVRIRILAVQPTGDRYDELTKSIGITPGNTALADKNLAYTRALSDRVMRLEDAAASNQWKGSIELKWLKKTPNYTMWLKDVGLPMQQVAHFSPKLIQQDNSGSVRAGAGSGEYIAVLVAEFNQLWSKSLPSVSFEIQDKP